MALAQPIAESPRRFSPFRSVLIISDSQIRIAELEPMLQRKGYNTVASTFSGSQLQGIPRHAPDVILISFAQSQSKLASIVSVLRKRYENKNVPIIGVFADEHADHTQLVDSALFEPAHGEQIAHRVSAMIRLNIMQTEIAFRMDTLREDFGIEYRLNPNAFDDRLRVLFIGKATPEFMVIINALEQKNVEVVAAFTSFTAFDFLHETIFDAVMMNALNGMEPGLTIAQTMRKNSALYHTPGLLLTRREMFESTIAYEHGISDIIYSDADEKDIQDRILELARFHRLHRQVKAEFENLGQAECLDESGTYSAVFFSNHLNRLVQHYSVQDLPVSLLTVQVKFVGQEPHDNSVRCNVLSQVGSMVKNLVRVYDVTARLSDNIYVIGFPGQPSSSLEPVVDRLNSMAGTLQFGPDSSGRKTYQVEFKLDLTELGHGVTGESWLAQQLGR
ncbi:MAG: hypothetical protein HKN36_11385 [Hellea sp.]|nr:hypothetical protein [Hellea sp.]